MLAGLAGATISLAISPGWFGELTTSGQGWIAIGLVIFAQWHRSGRRPAPTCSGRSPAHAGDAAAADDPRVREPVLPVPREPFFLEMLPYALILVALVIGSRQAMRQRLGAPAALGMPYVRGERGR